MSPSEAAAQAALKKQAEIRRRADDMGIAVDGFKR